MERTTTGILKTYLYTFRMDSQLHQFRAVVTLAQELHFGRAAKRLGLAQPHLSTLIRRIESSVGARLFSRRPRVALTPAGEVMADTARRVLLEVERGMERVRQVASGQVGSIVVGFASSVMLTELPAAFEAFSREHAGVDLRLREMHSAPQLDALRAGLIDVAFTREIPSDRRIRTQVIQREPFVVVLPDSHQLASEPSVSVAGLAAEPFVLFRRAIAPALHHQIIGICATGGFAPRIVQEADEWHTIFAFVRSGCGITLPPASLCRLNWPGLSFRSLTDVAAHATISLCWIPDRLSPAVSTFVDFIRSRTHENRDS